MMRQDTGRGILRLAATVFLLGWMAVIFWFSAQPASDSSRLSEFVAHQVAEVFYQGASDLQLEQLAARLDYPIRKAAHMTEYAILGVLFVPVIGGKRPNGWRTFLWAFVSAVCYAMTDELHQVFVPGRSGQASDVCVDAVGVLFGLLVLFLIQKLWRKHCEKRGHPVK